VPKASIVSPYYRVATRAIILDDQQRLLVMRNHDGEYELPGGGWEYGESFADCLAREIEEELGVELAGAESRVLCTYRGPGRLSGMALRIAVRARLKSYDFEPVDMAEAFWVTRDEFMALDLEPAAEEGIKEYADLIWGGSIGAEASL
jgi:8-oxo-dGTP pyrophosphatase MutT (NUDIX family)